jgi:hypothetical protein
MPVYRVAQCTIGRQSRTLQEFVKTRLATFPLSFPGFGECEDDVELQTK